MNRTQSEKREKSASEPEFWQYFSRIASQTLQFGTLGGFKTDYYVLLAAAQAAIANPRVIEKE